MSVVEYPKPYRLENRDHAVIFRPYQQLEEAIEKNQKYRATRKKDIAKILFKERISGVALADSQESAPYLEHNAQTSGDLELRYKINLSNQCQKSVVLFSGEISELNYVKKIHCRKQWCPVCGGKSGTIHKSRLHSILNRVDVDKYNLRQLVLTVPENLRYILQDREKLALLNRYSKDLVSKFFGVPVYDKKGHIKSYKLEKGVISYLHLFGDREIGIYKPHINLHILESKSEKLKLDQSVIDSIKKYWLKKLKQFDENIAVVDVHYTFRISKAHKLHALKYMSRPWSQQDFDSVNDYQLKKLLVLDLSGFQYLRFWGALSNCSYKDEMDISEIKQECEKYIDEKLISNGIMQFDYESWKYRLVEINDGFYLVIPTKGLANEPEKRKRITQAQERRNCLSS